MSAGRALESVSSFLISLGHDPEPAAAMAANLLGESIADPRVRRRYGSLKMTPHERERFADSLQARRVLVEGTLLSLDGDAVREGTVLSAHALCEAREARRPVTLRLGGATAQPEQIDAARSRLISELDSIDSLVEAALPAEVDVLQQGVGGGKAHPRVVHLQNRLNMLGHRVAADGRFGPVTTEAVKDFQAKAGMEPTGVVDEDTANALRHGRRVALVPPKVLGPGGPAAPAGMGDAKQPVEVGNSASQAGVNDKQPAETTTDAAVKKVPASKRVEAIVKLLKGLEGLQESAPTVARQRQITVLRRELEEVQAGATVCPTCGGPMRSQKMCQRGHRLNQARSAGKFASAPTQFHPWGPVEEGSNGAMHVHFSSSAELGQAEKDEVRAGRAANRTLGESAQTAALSVTHAPIGKGGKNWITKTEPGNTGQLPPYIQNVRNAIMRGGKSESEAHAIAIGRVEDWAEGKGGVHPEVRAAAAKAVAEWEALRAKSKAVKGAKKAVQESHVSTLDPDGDGDIDVAGKGKGGDTDDDVEEAKLRSPDVASIDPSELENRLSRLKAQGEKASGVEVARANQEAAMLVAAGKVKPGRFDKLREADTTADYPEYLSCPVCNAKALREAPVCPRGHRMQEAHLLMHALVRAIRFDRDLELLLRECPELEETWAHYDSERKSGRWGKLIKEGPLPGAHTTAPTSPGRGPTGALRNFDSMSGPKLAVTLEALAVHGEDPEAHQAAMYAAGKKLGMKIHVPQHPEPKAPVLRECACGAPVRGHVCQRGHRIEETWSDAARQAALIVRRERGKGALNADVRDPAALRKAIARRQTNGMTSPAHEILMSHEMQPSTEAKTLHVGFGAGHEDYGKKGLSYDDYSGSFEGTTLQRPTSMYGNERIAGGFGKPSGMLHLSVPKGHPMYEPTKHGGGFVTEQEHVLPAGTKVNVDREEMRDGVHHVYAHATMEG